MWEINCDITKFFFFFLVKIYRIFNSATLTSRNCIFIPVCVFTEWVYYSESDLQNMYLKAWLVDSIYHFYDSNVKNKIEPE